MINNEIFFRSYTRYPELSGYARASTIHLYKNLCAALVASFLMEMQTGI